MERIEEEGPRGKDELVLCVEEMGELADEIELDAHGNPKETFRSVRIEFPNGQGIEFSGFGGANEPVTAAVVGPGLNQESCVVCEEEKSDWVLNPIRGGPENRTVYICDECQSENRDVLSQLIG